MARGMSFFVNIGAKLLPSLNTTVSGVERRFAQMGRRISLAGAEMKAALKGVEEVQSRSLATLTKGAAVGYLGARAFRPFVDFEDSLIRVGNTAQVSGPALLRAGDQIQMLGLRYGYAGTDALTGANDFVAAGLSLKTAVGALAPTLRLAKTAGVEVGEASQAGIAMMQNLDVGVNDLARSFDIMAKASKEGRFEINDMARAFPGLSSRAKLLGMSGLDGVRRMSSMLQITRMNARDSEEAENNLLNLLDKFTGNETLDHFAEMGVSVEAMLARSKRNGTSFVDAMLSEMGRLTANGTDAIALTRLFPDRQARQAALALLTQRKELERIKRLTAGPVDGILGADFSRIARTSKFGFDVLTASLSKAATTLGTQFAPLIKAATLRLSAMVLRVSAWVIRNKELVVTIGKVVAALIALRTATAGLKLLFGGVTGVIGKFFLRGLASVAGRAAWAFSSLFGRLLFRGLMMLAPTIIGGLVSAFALLSNPVGWAIILVGAAAALAYFFRDEIAAAWPVVVQWFKSAFDGLVAFIKGIDWRSVGMFIADALTFGLASKGAAVVGAVRGWVKGVSSNGTKAPAVPANWAAAPAKGSFANWSTPVASPFKPILPPAGLANWTAPTPANDTGGTLRLPGRANGGPVEAGKAYMVGEEGPEPFIPGRSGVILPSHILEARGSQGGGQSMTVNQTFNIYDAHDPEKVAAAVNRQFRRLAGRHSVLLSD